MSQSTQKNQDISQSVDHEDVKEEKPKKKILKKKKEEKKKVIYNDDFKILKDLLEELEQTDENKIPHDKAKIYPSPVPFERHLSSLYNSDPNSVLLPTLLYGKNTAGELIKIIHGPPGTGKTYRLMKELELLIKVKKVKDNILICAPSNIGVINLYNRALSFGICGRLIISSSQSHLIPEDYNEKKINSKIYFSTVSMRTGSLLKHTEFQTIMIDEAAQCQEALTWGLLRKQVKRLYLAGDPLQLPALVSDEGNELNYGRSLMERLMDLGVNTTFLDTQRRMHQDIAEFSNKTFYNNKIKTEYNFNFDIAPIDIINVDGKENMEGTSFSNKIEAEKVNDIYNKLKETFDDVIVISPYTAQCNLFNKLYPELKVHTIDSYQGKEAEAVIITTVRTGKKIGFWNDYRRLNVGLTRARHALRVIGKVDTWLKEDGPLKQFAEFNNVSI